MAINGIIGSAQGSAGASNSFSIGRANIQGSSNNPLSDDATKVRISESEKNKTSGVESAIRYLNPLQTVVDTASSATDRASEVLNKTLEIAKQVASEVDPLKKASLSSDGAALLDELDLITATKTPEGVSVIGQGSISYSVSLDKPGDSKGNSITVNLPDIRISKDDLGLSSVTSASLEQSNSDTQDSLQQAIQTVSDIATALKSTITQILDTASANGVSRAAQGAVTDKDAGELAEKIASAIKNSPGLTDTNNLDANKVVDLIKVPDEEKSREKQSTAPVVNVPKEKKKEEETFNPILASTEGVTSISDDVA